MSDLTANQGQVPTTSTTGQAPTANAAQAADAQPQTIDAEYVRRIREEAAQHRTALRQTQEELKALRDAQLSETERAANRLKELETQQQTWQRERQELLTRQEVERQARKLNLVDEEAAYRLLDTASIEYDASGKPSNVDALLAQMAESRPWLKGSAGAQQGASVPTSNASVTNPARPAAGQQGVFTTNQIANRAFYEANREAIMQAAREGRVVEG